MAGWGESSRVGGGRALWPVSQLASVFLCLEGRVGAGGPVDVQVIAARARQTREQRVYRCDRPNLGLAGQPVCALERSAASRARGWLLPGKRLRAVGATMGSKLVGRAGE